MTDDTTPTPTPEQLALAAEIERDFESEDESKTEPWKRNLDALMQSCSAVGLAPEDVFAPGTRMRAFIDNHARQPAQEIRDAEDFAELKDMLFRPGPPTGPEHERFDELLHRLMWPREFEQREDTFARLKDAGNLAAGKQIPSAARKAPSHGVRRGRQPQATPQGRASVASEAGRRRRNLPSPTIIDRNQRRTTRKCTKMTRVDTRHSTLAPLPRTPTSTEADGLANPGRRSRPRHRLAPPQALRGVGLIQSDPNRL